MKSSFIILFIIACNALSQAQSSVEKKYKITLVNLRETREIWIGLPENYDARHGSPTLNVLDTETRFDISYSIMKELALNDTIPEYIVIGFPYVNNEKRFKDLAFASTDYYSIGEPDSVAAFYFSKEKSSGGPVFYNYLEEEVMPFVNFLHLTSGFDFLIGRSTSGYFVAYNLSMGSLVHLMPTNFMILVFGTAKLRPLIITRTHLLKNYLQPFLFQQRLEAGLQYQRV